MENDGPFTSMIDLQSMVIFHSYMKLPQGKGSQNNKLDLRILGMKYDKMMINHDWQWSTIKFDVLQ